MSPQEKSKDAWVVYGHITARRIVKHTTGNTENTARSAPRFSQVWAYFLVIICICSELALASTILDPFDERLIQNVALQDAISYVRNNPLLFIVRKNMTPPPSDPIILRVGYGKNRFSMSVIFWNECLVRTPEYDAKIKYLINASGHRDPIIIHTSWSYASWEAHGLSSYTYRKLNL